MTEKDMISKLNTAERMLGSSISDLREAAIEVGHYSAKKACDSESYRIEAARAKTKMITFFPLIATGVGVILLIFKQYVWGVILIAVGIGVSIKLHGIGADAEYGVMNSANSVMEESRRLARQLEEEINSIK